MSRYIPEKEFSNIIKLYIQGITYSKIAEVYGVDRMVIYHVIVESGIDTSKRKKGRGVRNKEYVESCLEEANINFNIEDSYHEKHGMTKSEYDKSTNLDYKYYKRFSTHKSNSKRRNIEFNLTFKEWLDIWSESGCINESGKFKNNYVMARKYDTGAYEVGNVSIVKTVDNLSEIAINRALKTISAHANKSIEQIKEAVYG